MREIKLKEIAAESAVSLVEDGMVVGLGSGSTAEIAIRIIGRRIKMEGIRIKGIPTSLRSEMVAIESGIPITSLSQHPHIDISIDGADEVDSDLNLIKGGGGAHTKEKIVSLSSERLIIIVDETKLSERLEKPVPTEIIPYAMKVVEKQMKELGGKPLLRTIDGKPFITENGNLILDVDFGRIEDPPSLGKELSSVAGLVEHGIFTNASEVHVGRKDGVEVLRR
ncbi:MAG: ribose-5-phosphate isomerase RpiA [Candidatus Syntropharchaeia archaeon]